VMLWKGYQKEKVLMTWKQLFSMGIYTTIMYYPGICLTGLNKTIRTQPGLVTEPRFEPTTFHT
jgi:hypothetical protein